MEPTEAQAKEFWEKCGLTKDGVWWYSPTGKMMDVNTPRIDLNNLFKYAVPGLPFLRMNYEPISEQYRFETMKLNESGLKVGKDKDPALALFWACYPVITGKEAPHE